MYCLKGCKTENGERANAEAIRGEGGRVVAHVRRKCGWRADAAGVTISAVDKKKPEQHSLLGGSKPPPCKCESWRLQKVLNGAGEVMALVCGQCFKKYGFVSCVGCGKEFHVKPDDRRKFPVCSDAYAKKASKERSKAKRQAEAAAEQRERKR